MSNDGLKTFPSDEITALTMLYLQHQDLSNLTPEELWDKYDEVHNRISARKEETDNNDFVAQTI